MILRVWSYCYINTRFVGLKIHLHSRDALKRAAIVDEETIKQLQRRHWKETQAKTSHNIQKISSWSSDMTGHGNDVWSDIVNWQSNLRFYPKQVVTSGAADHHV